MKVKQRAWSVSEILERAQPGMIQKSLRRLRQQNPCPDPMEKEVRASAGFCGSRACRAISSDRVGAAAVSKGRRGAVRPVTVGHSCDLLALELEAGSM